MNLLHNVTLLGIDCVDLERLRLAADISTKEIAFGSVKLLSSIPSDDKRVIKISPVRSTEEYSDFIIKRLTEYVSTEFVLIIQYDGFILNSAAWSDEFLKYDYIGAPWAHLGNLRVGNGGFSLRSKKLLDWLAQNWQIVNARVHPEDIFISKFARPYLEKANMTFAPLNVAYRFSKEGNEESVVWNGEFGFHGISYTDISGWFEKHPEHKQRLTYKLDDYATLMCKHPIYDGTVHTFRFRKQDMRDYVELSRSKKNYEVRLTQQKYYDLDKIKIGHTVVFKRSGVSFEEVSVQAFEKQVRNIEKFDSLSGLRFKYPNLQATPPWEYIKKWKRPFVPFLGDWALPRNESYSVFWF